MTKGITPFLRRARDSFEYRTGIKLSSEKPFNETTEWLQALPSEPGELASSELFKRWWYYSAELLPGVVTNGIYTRSFPMLPRIMLRNCEVSGADCLDLGSMEGLVPTLLARRGARRVVATDAVDHCGEKMAALKHYYGVNFEFQKVGLLYDLWQKFPGQGFDLINLSGLLYHVFSPLLVLCGVRPLLKRNGLIVISTGVILNDSYSMEFNDHGRIQEEGNTFWYVSVPLLDYLLRYLKLAPLDCKYIAYDQLDDVHTKLSFDRPSGFLSVVCRATDNVLAQPDDEWMKNSSGSSWEYTGLFNSDVAASQTRSRIAYDGNSSRDFFRSDVESQDLWAAVSGTKPCVPASVADTHTLMLDDMS